MSTSSKICSFTCELSMVLRSAQGCAEFDHRIGSRPLPSSRPQYPAFNNVEQR